MGAVVIRLLETVEQRRFLPTPRRQSPKPFSEFIERPQPQPVKSHRLVLIGSACDLQHQLDHLEIEGARLGIGHSREERGVYAGMVSGSSMRTQTSRP